MAIIKYLDNKGLSYFWQKVKNAIPVLFSTTTETIKEEDKKDNSIGFVEDTNQIIYNNKYYGNGFFIGTESEPKAVLFIGADDSIIQQSVR